MDDDEDEGDDEVEDQPDVDHLDVGRCGKTLVHLPSNEAWPIVQINLSATGNGHSVVGNDFNATFSIY